MNTYVGALGALVVGALLLSCAPPEQPAVVARAPQRPTATSPAAASVPEAAARPVRVRIPAIGVDSPLEELGVTRRGRLRPPVEPRHAGWFPDSAVPGDLGSAVIAGHRDSAEGPAVFWRLTDLRRGDEVAVTRSDGTTARFQVVEVRRVARKGFPTDEVYGATPDSTLRLITCGGLYDHVHGRYLDNVLVLALSV